MSTILKIIITMTFIFSAKADVLCEGKSHRGNDIKVVFTERLAMVKSSGATHNLFFENLERTWDGHGTGLLIGHRDSEKFNKKISALSQ